MPAPTWTRTKPSAPWKPSSTPRARPRISTSRRSVWPPSTPSSTTPARAPRAFAPHPPTPAQGLLLSSFTLLRIGAAQRAAADPAKRELLDKKEELERKIDTLKYQKAAMADDEYRRAADRRAAGAGARAAGVRQMSRASAHLRHLLMVWAGAGTAWAATPEECQVMRKHGRRAEARACYQSLTELRDPYCGRKASGAWPMFQDANEQFRLAVAQSPKNAMYRVRWGRLMKERFNSADADGPFQRSHRNRPQERAGLPGPGRCRRRQLRSQSRAVGRQGARARSEARGSPRAAGQSAARRLAAGQSGRTRPMKR